MVPLHHVASRGLNSIRQSPLPVLYDEIGNLLQTKQDPSVRPRTSRVIGLCYVLNSRLVLQVLHGPVVLILCWIVYPHCSSAELIQDRKHRDIARSISDVDHIAKRNPPVLRGYHIVDTNVRINVCALIDFPYGPGLRGVIEEVPNLTYEWGPCFGWSAFRP